MRYDPSKAYPYPVLRPESSDYPEAEFEVELELERIEKTTALRITAEFQLSDQTLLELLKLRKAQYVLSIRSSATHHRSAHCSHKPTIKIDFKDGELSEKTEIRGLMVATQKLSGFQADGWHQDWRNIDRKPEIPAGAVLAEDEPKIYFIDTAEEAQIGSIFELASDPELQDGKWRCSLDSPKVVLRMSPADYERFKQARERAGGSQEAAYIMNSVYLPALVYVLQEADNDEGDYAELRWYRALDRRLEDAKCPSIRQGEDRLGDAQILLEQPFSKMPLLATEPR